MGNKAGLDQVKEPCDVKKREKGFCQEPCKMIVTIKFQTDWEFKDVDKIAEFFNKNKLQFKLLA